MEKAILERVRQAIAEGVFPGCVVGVVNRHGERALYPYGALTYESLAQPVRDDTLYDMASITKSIPTASLALMLIDQGRLSLEEKLSTYVPLFRNSDKDTVRIKHLLTHTMDGYGTASLNTKNAEELFQILYTRDFDERPGTLFKYTNVPALLLGRAVEGVLGKPLDVLADEFFFAPLGMHHTTFHPETLMSLPVAPTEIDGVRGVVERVVHDESAYTCVRSGTVVGHAGLFSTAGDILTFLEMLLNSGTWNGREYFSPSIIEAMETNQIEGMGVHGLGWELDQKRFMGAHAHARTFGRGGFTGTVCVCDRERGVAYVVFSNRTYPKRPVDISAFRAVAAHIGDIVLGAYN